MPNPISFPSSTLAQCVNQKENNLNAIRLGLSLLVLYSHCYPLSFGTAAATVQNFQNTVGYVAVDLFFFISGLLIAASWLRSKSMNDYLRKRVLRIYPGFIGALLVSTAIITAVNPGGMLKTVLSWHGVKSFIQDSVSLSSHSLNGPEVFPRNPFPNFSNGSLWTIPKEFQCYLVICVLGLFCLFKFRWAILAIFGYIYLMFCKAAYMGVDISHMDRRFLTYFLAGTCAWLWRDKIPVNWPLALTAVGLMILPAFTPLPLAIILPFALTYIVLWLGYSKPLSVTRWCDSTDLSYGVYLYAFPVQQLIATTAWGRHPTNMLLVAVPITLLLAFASWHLVEKRFLGLKASKFTDRDPALSPPQTPGLRSYPITKEPQVIDTAVAPPAEGASTP